MGQKSHKMSIEGNWCRKYMLAPITYAIFNPKLQNEIELSNKYIFLLLRQSVCGFCIEKQNEHLNSNLKNTAAVPYFIFQVVEVHFLLLSCKNALEF